MNDVKRILVSALTRLSQHIDGDVLVVLAVYNYVPSLMNILFYSAVLELFEELILLPGVVFDSHWELQLSEFFILQAGNR